jgi:hypothetical protein
LDVDLGWSLANHHRFKGEKRDKMKKPDDLPSLIVPGFAAFKPKQLTNKSECGST